MSQDSKRAKVILSLLLIFALIALIAFCIWWIDYRNYETTDNAYVKGNLIVISSRQEGSILAYHADDTDFVKEGDLLVSLDPTDYLLNLELRKAALALAVRQVVSYYEDVQQKQANLSLQREKHAKALLDFNNRKGLIDSKAIALEDFEHVEAELKVAKASVDLAVSQLEAAKANLGWKVQKKELANHPIIEKAKAEFINAYFALRRCQIVSPVSGYVANRNVQVGQTIRVATPLLSVVPIDQLWVEANFKETQLSRLRNGQNVKLISDFYGDKVTFNGKIAGIVPGTGSIFSLLPPQNATGNWIKIIQRVPVRLTLDPEEVKKYPLILGLSMVASVDVSDAAKPRLTEKTQAKSFKTVIFEENTKELDKVIDKVLKDNLGEE